MPSFSVVSRQTGEAEEGACLCVWGGAPHQDLPLRIPLESHLPI